MSRSDADADADADRIRSSASPREGRPSPAGWRRARPGRARATHGSDGRADGPVSARIDRCRGNASCARGSRPRRPPRRARTRPDRRGGEPAPRVKRNPRRARGGDTRETVTRANDALETNDALDDARGDDGDGGERDVVDDEDDDDARICLLGRRRRVRSMDARWDEDAIGTRTTRRDEDARVGDEFGERERAECAVVHRV